MSRAEQPFDIVEKPKHYNAHPSGYETIELTELLNANLSNALKYCWRRNDKDNLLQDLSKARWYARRHCDNSEIHIPIFASRGLLEQFTYKATNVLRYEPPPSLLGSVLQALADGEPRRMLERIEEEIARLTQTDTTPVPPSFE